MWVSMLHRDHKIHASVIRKWLAWAAFAAASAPSSLCQTPSFSPARAAASKRAPAATIKNAHARPKLVVLLVVDQMRGDYVDKFLPQWTGGLRRLVEEGAWFRDAAYPYANTPTCLEPPTTPPGP